MNAKHTIHVDRNGLQIDGQPLYMLAGQLHYFRFPKEEWRDLLRTAQAGGLNTIDTVIPWNLHEPTEGYFDFTDFADLPAYLDLCQELGLFAIVRPGPYICAEWENGGFPAWLTTKEGVELRVDNPVYLTAMARWFDQLFPILAERQITRSGPIILCQIENEHWASGRYGHDQHQTTLAGMALERGIEVPQYTCMGAMNKWPEFRNGWSGIAEKLAQSRTLWPDNPMIVSELWSGWFDNWGDSSHNHKTPARFDQILAQLTAVGASGFSHWMWAGGTNFGFWGGRTVGGDTIHMTTSYDYDAPINEYGGLTEKYFVARRHQLFLATLGSRLAPVLADAISGGPEVVAPAAVKGRSEAGGAPYRNVRAASTALAAWRDFTATFLQNNGYEGQTYQVFYDKPRVHVAIGVEAGTIKPLFGQMPLGDLGLTLDFHTSRVLGFWEHASSDVLVCYGSEGEVGQLQISSNQHWSVLNDGGTQCKTNEHTLHLHYWIGDRPTVVRAKAARDLIIVLLTEARAARWWPIGEAGFVCGPHLALLAEAQDSANELAIEIDQRGVQPCYWMGNDGHLELLDLPQSQVSTSPIVWRPLNWQRHAVAERSNSAGWQAIETPRSLDELGCYTGYGWYRATFELATPTQMTLTAPWLADRARVLVDGEDRGWLGIHPQGSRMTLPLDLSAGQHDLHLLVDNLGRFNYGSNTGERKGLLDTLYWGGQQHDLTNGWVALWQEAVFAGEAIAAARPSAVRPDAVDVSLDHFAFQGPSVWLLREFEVQEGRDYILQMIGDRNPGAIFINGQNVARVSRHYGGGYVKQNITRFVQPGTNVITLNIQGYSGISWHANLLEYNPQERLHGPWSFCAGVTPGDIIQNSNGLSFHRTTFSYDPAKHGSGPFKLALYGLRKGQIWLNEKNVGRYWQVGPQEYYKLPVSWLQGENELLLLDEEGASPDHIWIGIDDLGVDQRVVITRK